MPDLVVARPRVLDAPSMLRPRLDKPVDEADPIDAWRALLGEIARASDEDGPIAAHPARHGRDNF
ncbi:MAG: hypothetical protein ABI585_13010 [Betaproteobacteria bacterium]